MYLEAKEEFEMAASFPVLESRNDRRLAAVTTAVSAVALVVGLTLATPVATWIGVVGLAIGLWNLLDRRVKLRVDEVGIRYARWGDEYLTWSEIAAVETRTFRGVEQVAIVPVDPEAAVRKLPFERRWQSWLAERLWGGRFVISTAALEHGTPALVEFLRRFHAARSA